jgi:hypothetical protein
VDEKCLGFSAALMAQSAAAVRGVTVPWTLTAFCLAGAWLMFSRLVLGTWGITANNDHLVGALIITIAVCATAEVARPLRFLNLLLGLWLIAAPWLLTGSDASSVWNDIGIEIAVVGLSLRRGTRSNTGRGTGTWSRPPQAQTEPVLDDARDDLTHRCAPSPASGIGQDRDTADVMMNSVPFLPTPEKNGSHTAPTCP